MGQRLATILEYPQFSRDPRGRLRHRRPPDGYLWRAARKKYGHNEQPPNDADGNHVSRHHRVNSSHQTKVCARQTNFDRTATLQRSCWQHGRQMRVSRADGCPPGDFDLAWPDERYLVSGRHQDMNRIMTALPGLWSGNQQAAHSFVEKRNSIVEYFMIFNMLGPLRVVVELDFLILSWFHERVLCVPAHSCWVRRGLLCRLGWKDLWCMIF